MPQMSPVVVFLKVCVCLLTITGNAMTIVIVVTKKVQQIPHNQLLASLAVADMFMGMFGLPMQLAHDYDIVWTHGTLNCAAWLACKKLSFSASVFGLCAIAVDRVWAITSPLYYTGQYRRTRLVIALVWAMSLCLCLLPFLGYHSWTRENRVCDYYGASYLASMTVLLFLMPMIVMIGSYVSIFSTLYGRLNRQEISGRVTVSAVVAAVSTSNTPPLAEARAEGRQDPLPISQTTTDGSDESLQIRSTERQMPTEPNSSSPIIPAPSEFSNCSSFGSPQSLEREVSDGPVYNTQRRQLEMPPSTQANSHRILLVAVVVIGLFTVSTLPYMVGILIEAFCPQCMPKSNLWKDIVIWIACSNSAVNPFIYTAFNRDFRKAYKKLFIKQ